MADRRVLAADAGSPRRRVSRLQITPTSPAALTVNVPDLAITPDSSASSMWAIAERSSSSARWTRWNQSRRFTGAPTAPFVSPDGQWIAFLDQAQMLKRVKVTGGPPATMATLDSVVRGATWFSDDTIIASTDNGATGLLRVSTTGGPTTVLTRPDRSQGEADHRWPESLPGGQAVLFTITSLTGSIDDAQVAALDLRTGTRTVLFRGGSHARYVPSMSSSSSQRGAGHLVYASGDALWGVPFDLARLERRGTPVPVVFKVLTTELGAVDAVVARDGTLAYVPGSRLAAGQAPRTLVWVDRQGRETSIPAPPRGYVQPRLSPDGTRIAVFVADQQFDIWVWSLAPGNTTLSRRTFDSNADTTPVWTADGKRIVFTSEQGGVRNLFWQADDDGGVERLIESPNRQAATGVAPDGRAIFTETAPATREDVMAVTLNRPRSVTPLVQSPSRERNGVVSPDATGSRMNLTAPASSKSGCGRIKRSARLNGATTAVGPGRSGCRAAELLYIATGAR